MGDYRDARDNAAIIIECSNVCPFKWHRNVFGCACCTYTSPDFGLLKTHMSDHLMKSEKTEILRNSRPGDTFKTDISNLRCNLCQESVKDIATLMDHLIEKHRKPLKKMYGSGIVPYVLDNGFTCAYCCESFDRFIVLNAHVFDHIPKHACSECGHFFSEDRLRAHILRSHGKTRQTKLKPKFGDHDARHNASIVLECSNACPFKWHRNVFGCAYCTYTSSDFGNLKNHMTHHPAKSERIEILRNSRTTDVVKADVANLRCDLCQEDVKDLATLMDHLLEKHNKPIIKKCGSGIVPYLLDKEFTCAYCNETFDRFTILNTHVIEHNRKCACSQCGHFFSSKERLRNHTVRSHGKARKVKLRSKFGYYDDARHNASIIIECSNVCPFKWHRNVFGCAYCEFTSADFGPLKAHYHPKKREVMRYARPTDTLKADVTNLKCELCDQAITDLKTLLDHLSEIHGKQIKKQYGPGMVPYLLSDGFTCADCGLQFDRFIKLNFHVNEHYPNCICPQCGQAFSNSNRLKHHSLRHKKGTLQFKCAMCGEIFTTRFGKQKHMETRHDIHAHKCPYCNDTFKSYSQRLQHLNDYHGKKIEYPCSMCSTVFKTASRRAQHVQHTHLKNKRYSCSVCDHRFINTAQLKRHLVKHSGERNYKCQVCKKSYPRMSSLTQHMRIHNNDKRFVCAHCNIGFVQKCSLKSHTRTHHPYDCVEPSSSQTNSELTQTQEIPFI